ncbi:hypothetical protein Kpol_1049p23 [Vanderwaltozyma polyspora DSM 70294]|uniref:ABC transporter domain-containing protein n=1 Tax=Vanderwaltozyma polyspora (strain ATCC 22028 / DSM 70294 / BCRC 21397 / CBS 2163 / NBRC 10782 / NRRL Y-8283 / UCD 57-17) TaxID=436907 RepID=A7TPR3_VANPO|nr:uncharacterized protein Kpol_1049p23 [Vanderwaltozyma polyspora DSM 70294]EDO15765.1 hypothetical protein Kpol_1049p23 [Vanderwaltozyma polyspora DSM 70294]
MICLARALLRSTKILLIDEATASIDYEADAKLQETIQTEFQDVTIVAIAHRLQTIIDYDKILVLDAGQVIEYDHPYTLLKNESGHFYDICKESGNLNSLFAQAYASYSQT